MLPPIGAAPSGLGADDGWVAVEALVGFAEASDLVAAALEGVEWRSLGRTVRVSSVEVSGNGDGRMAFVIELAGDVPARVRLVGTPVIDANTEELVVPDLDVTLESGGGLPRMLVWVARLLPGILRARARLPLDTLVPVGLEGPFELRLADGALLEASLADLEVTGIESTEEVVLVRARVRPDAAIRVES
jgi:hypothetical protein